MQKFTITIIVTHEGDDWASELLASTNGGTDPTPNEMGRAMEYALDNLRRAANDMATDYGAVRKQSAGEYRAGRKESRVFTLADKESRSRIVERPPEEEGRQ